MVHVKLSRIALALVVLGGALASAAPPAAAVTYVDVMLLVRWDGEGCIGTATGSSMSLVARDMFQSAGTRTATWPGTTSGTRCKGDSYGGLVQVGPVSLIKYDGFHTYRLEVSITDATGTVTSYSANQNLRVGGSCTASRYYMGTTDVYCSSTQPASNYLGRANAMPANPTISHLYADPSDPAHAIHVAWTGVSPMPSDFNFWEVHVGTTPGFTPGYSYPNTLKRVATWGTSSATITGLAPGETYCFKVRNTDDYWRYSDFTSRNHRSFGESAERCASTRSSGPTVTTPNGGEVWSGTHAVRWTGGAPAFAVDVSKDDGATWTTAATGVGSSAWSWDTTAWPDGASYRVRARDATSSDASNAAFTVDNTDPVTEAAVEGPTCNGWHTEPPTVTLRATDNLAGVRATYWSVDGGARVAYAAPFQLAGDGARDFRYWSEDRADAPNEEAPRNLTVRIDTLDPETRLALGAPSHAGDRLYVNSSTDVVLEATDAGSGVDRTEYRLDGGAWTTYDAPFRLSGPDREVRIEYRSLDRACHVEPVRSQLVFLDNTAPEVALPTPPPGSVTRGDETAFDGPAPLLAALEETLRPLPAPALPTEDACEVARILARGLRDNAQPDAADLLDALLCAGPDAPAVVSGEVTVRADARDPVVNGGASGMDRVEFLVDGALRGSATEAPWEWVWNTTREENGRHTVRAVAFDHLGQSAFVEREFLVANADAGVALCDADEGLGLPAGARFVGDLVAYALEAIGLGCDVA